MNPSARRAAGLSQWILPAPSTRDPPKAPTSQVNSQVSTSCCRQESKKGYFTTPAALARRARRTSSSSVRGGSRAPMRFMSSMFV